jgi:hypothetical protein
VAGHGRTALPSGGHAWEVTAGRRRPSLGEDDGEVRAGEEATASAARMMEMTVHRSRSSSERRRRRSRSSSDWRRRSSARGLPPRPVRQRRRAGERVGGGVRVSGRAGGGGSGRRSGVRASGRVGGGGSGRHSGSVRVSGRAGGGAAGGAATACRRAGGRAAAAGSGVYAAGAVGADGRVGRGHVRDRVPPIYDGVMCAVIDYYYLRRPRKALVNNS